ncbi:MAG: phytanoyl-CoA dioxygenase family protein, partial [Acidimicrobiales bacterium]
GDEVVAWRTQMFVVGPHTKGTFWHAATTFTEDGDLPALTPPPDVPAAMANVSCWIALEDVDADHACLRIIPGTHSDVRLDTMIRRFSQDRLGFVMSLDRADRGTAITALRYTGDIFMAGQVVFDVAMGLVPDLYDTAVPAHYPMKAGECLLFSSNNLHGSFANATDEPRLAMGIRYTSADVGIYEGQATIPYSTGKGNTMVDMRRLQSGVPVHTRAGPVAPAQG